MKIVVIGGASTGIKIAKKIVDLEKPEIELIVFEKNNFLNIGHENYSFRNIVKKSKEKNKMSEIELVEHIEYGINIKTHHLATKIDHDNNLLHVVNLGNGEKNLVSYDHLIIATGSNFLSPNLKGYNLKNVFSNLSKENMDEISTLLSLETTKEVMILGATTDSILLANKILKWYPDKNVSIFDKNEMLIPSHGDRDTMMLLLELFAQSNVKFHFNKYIIEFKGDEKITHFVTDNDEVFPVDLVLTRVDPKPDHAIFKNKLKLNYNNTVPVDPFGRTNIENIWALGSVANTYHFFSKKKYPNRSKGVTKRQVESIVNSIINEPAAPVYSYGVVHSRLNNTMYYSIGFTQRESIKFGIKATSVLKTFDYHNHKTTIKINFNSERNIIGSQIIVDNSHARTIISFLKKQIKNMSTIEEFNAEIALSDADDTIKDVWKNMIQNIESLI